PDLAQLDDLEVWEFFLDDVTEPHLALFMPAIRQRSRKQRDLSPLARPEEASEQIAGKTAGGPVVDSDIGDARDVQDVGGQGDDLDAGLGEPPDRFANRWVVEGDDPDPLGGARNLGERLRQPVRVEPLDRRDIDLN